MELALIIVGGIVVTTLIAAVGDYFTKARQAQANAAPVQELLRKIETLEGRVAEQESKILLLEENVSFTAKLLEDKRPAP